MVSKKYENFRFLTHFYLVAIVEGSKKFSRIFSKPKLEMFFILEYTGLIEILVKKMI
jgi:hypothetical protein